MKVCLSRLTGSILKPKSTLNEILLKCFHPQCRTHEDRLDRLYKTIRLPYFWGKRAAAAIFVNNRSQPPRVKSSGILIKIATNIYKHEHPLCISKSRHKYYSGRKTTKYISNYYRDTGLLLYILLNHNRAYCVMLRSSKVFTHAKDSI